MQKHEIAGSPSQTTQSHTNIFSYCHITAQKLKFSIKDFYSKWDHICRKLRNSSHLVKKSLMENFIFVECKLQTARFPWRLGFMKLFIWLTHFMVLVFFYIPLKTSENLWLSYVFRGYKKWLDMKLFKKYSYIWNYSYIFTYSYYLQLMSRYTQFLGDLMISLGNLSGTKVGILLSQNPVPQHEEHFKMN